MKHQALALIGGAAIIAVSAFFGGTAYAGMKAKVSGQRSAWTDSRSGTNPAFGGVGGAQAGGQRMRGGQSGAMRGNLVAGEVLSVQDGMMTVKLPDGGSKIVIIADSTEFTKTVPGAKSDIVAGTSILATGEANGDGSLTSKSVQIRPSGSGTPTLPADR